jgi:drug/metabolite transporter (DMT)-like permease
MTFVSGVWASVLSPLVTTIGFIFWEYTWSQKKNRSAFALNLYKCCFASILFLFTLWVLSLIKDQENSTDILPTHRLVQEYNHFNTGNHVVSFRSLWSLWSIDESHIDDDASRKQIIGYLILSSTIGIIIGDILWLQALEILGTVRVVFMDALKPFCAAVFGSILLNEPFRWTILLGITITMVGIVLVSLEQQDTTVVEDGDQLSDKRDSGPDMDLDLNSASNLHHSHMVTVDDNDMCDYDASVKITATVASDSENDVGTPNVFIHTDRHKSVPDTTGVEQQFPTEALLPNSPSGSSLPLWIGYCMSIVNVVLDTYGSVLTKDYGVSLSIWEINFIRFGFAGAVLLLVSIGMIAYHWLRQLRRYSDQSMATIVVKLPSSQSPPTVEVNLSETGSTNAVAPPIAGSGTNEQVKPSTIATPWYRLPILDDPVMTKLTWFYVSIGVVFVTYIAPTLSNYALFEISLALTLTLTSIGPLYALPLSFLVRRYMYDSDSQAPSPQPPTLRAWIGAVLSICGIILLAYTGN